MTKTPSLCRVAGSPVQFECVYHETVRLPGRGAMGTVDAVTGRVVLVHLQDEVIGPDGRIGVVKIRPLARLGCFYCTTVDSTFEMVIPGHNEDLLAGLEGAAGKQGENRAEYGPAPGGAVGAAAAASAALRVR